MKKRLSILLLLIIITGFLFTCASSQMSQQGKEPIPVEKIKNDQPSLFFWKLENGNAILYFLGSLHLATQDIYPLDDRIYQAFQESDTLIVELDNTKPENIQKIQQLTMAKGSFTGMETIENYASPELLEKLTKLATEYNIPQAIGVKLKPWIIELTIANLELQKLGFDGALGLDSHFLTKANATNKDIRELETVEEQISMLSDVPIDQQILSLESTLAELDCIPVYLNEIVSTWQAGNIEKFFNLTMQSYETQPEFMDVYDRLFTQRNMKWINYFEKLISTGGKYFIITGAAHLAGESSVIDLLVKKGYKLIQY